MIENEPLVSVSLLTYNQEDFISDAIESILSQNYENLEVVIGDDCSQDRTWNIVQKYQHQYPEKIKSFRNKKNLGVTGNSNKILKRCDGKYIAMHAGDDVFLPGKIRKQVLAMELNERIILCHHNLEVFESESGDVLRYTKRSSKWVSQLTGSAKHVVKNVVALGSGIQSISVMVRSSAIPEHGFRDDFINSDFIMWVETLASNSGLVIFIDEVLSRYRRHANNITNSEKNMIEMEYLALNFVCEEYPELTQSAYVRISFLKYREAVAWVKNGKYRKSRKLLRESLQYSLNAKKWVGWKWLALWFYSWLKQFRFIR